ncbi:hypothetical protein BH20GEM3_BH20GEM3_09040 [soil metagenome]
MLLSIGMSNTSQEFCGRNVTSGCWSGSFMDQAAADPSVNRATLVIVNGAQGGRDAQSWTKAGNNVYDVVRDERLRPLGVTEKHVQVVWLKQANAGPKLSLPDTSADTHQLERSLGEIVRALRIGSLLGKMHPRAAGCAASRPGRCSPKPWESLEASAR